MKVNYSEKHTDITELSLSLQHTFECGQCFRFTPKGDNGFEGVAYGKYLYIHEHEDGFRLHCTKDEFDKIWHDFLHLDFDYDAVAHAFPNDDFTRQAIEHGRGLRILAQQPWEALCSFIISQCNNIKRISSIIKTLCELFGEPLADGQFAFPTADKMAQLTESDLAPLRCGYRAPYLISAAQAVNSGQLCFDKLRDMDTDDARAEIMKLQGVGRKVADCFLLFGLSKLNAFPVDTWMKKAAVFYPNGFDGQAFGQYAGIAQQYIFYYARAKKIDSKA